MYAAFEFHSAINTVTTDLENNFLKASQFSRVGIHNFNAPAPSFCITGIHPKKYACKQSGFVAAGTASYLYNNIFIIVGSDGNSKTVNRSSYTANCGFSSFNSS